MTNKERIEEIEWALSETNYKYFGDYEFSDNQRKAVEILEKAAKDFISHLKEYGDFSKATKTDGYPGLIDLGK